MRVTANHLTFLRIILLPLPCFLLYGGPEAKLTALGIGSLLGLTDFLDGKLARRHGSTPLGAFLDPIADKIFIVALYTFLSHLGFLPLWVAGGVFIRELLVSSLRRKVPGALAVTWLAKMKTTIQMFVAALVVAIVTFPGHTFYFLLGAGVILVFGGILARLNLIKFLLVVFMALGLLLLSFLAIPQIVLILGSVALLVTWLSALDYLKIAFSSISLKDFLKVLPGALWPAVVLVFSSQAGSWWILIPLVVVLLFLREALLFFKKEKAQEIVPLVFFLLALLAMLTKELIPVYLIVSSVFLVFENISLFISARPTLFRRT
ncbi:CDP-alcohol phosphatidyltransferase family protein [Thermodesulfatator autotrophicus]|uniref:CDP-diacylglycerol--glycerol-3-phosphate 3-phosphatidyltransferase n=1 Tax=Thermodesulfatator autotrophicus TaxID=1795632 RepID=A0A177E651_9BACT|nr:CDP-alcohol phosphatidyltransferase family protein [Thermodesulfatator autotrophicus]OAG27424.1 hypothetical protein TH606_07075 [Thermodesulfatator autotrophicus]